VVTVLRLRGPDVVVLSLSCWYAGCWASAATSRAARWTLVPDPCRTAGSYSRLRAP